MRERVRVRERESESERERERVREREKKINKDIERKTQTVGKERDTRRQEVSKS